MIQVKTQIDARSQKSESKVSIIAYWIVLGLGLAMLSFYILQTFVWHNGDNVNLCLGIFCTALAILMEIYIAQQVKSADNSKVTYVYDFELGFFKVTKLRNGENMGTVKYYYDDMTVISENKDYIFLRYSAYLAFPVDKRNINANDLPALRSILHLKEVVAKEDKQPVAPASKPAATPQPKAKAPVQKAPTQASKGPIVPKPKQTTKTKKE